MTTAAIFLVSSGATIAVTGACVWVAKALAELRQELEELKSRSPSAPPAPAEAGGRTPPRMMSALYPERRGALDSLSGVPGWPGLALAAGLALIAMGLSFTTGDRARELPTEKPIAIAPLRAAVDSMSGEIRKLGDSLRVLAARTGPQPAAPVARPVWRPAPVRSKSQEAVLPPAPSLQH